MGEITNDGAIPALELAMRYAGARQRVLAHNIANIDTPNFRPTDVAPAEFQAALSRAIDARRAGGAAAGGGGGNQQGELPFKGTRQIRIGADGRMTLTPRTPSGNVLFHDRNNRDLERLMQDQAENVGAFRLATDLLRSRYEIIRSAIAERV